MKRRHPFILLETLIALALVFLTIIPITSYPFRIYEKEINSLLSVELNRVYESAFLALQQELLENIFFEDVTDEPLDLSLGTFAIDLPPVGTFPFKAFAKITKTAPDDTEKESKHKLLSCQISLKSDKKGLQDLKPVEYLLHISSSKP